MNKTVHEVLFETQQIVEEQKKEIEKLKKEVHDLKFYNDQKAETLREYQKRLNI